MKQILLTTLLLSLLSCTQHKKEEEKAGAYPYSIVEVKETNNTPTVDIEKYFLVSRPGEDRKNDAAEIMKIKRQWPLVMQNPSVAGFDSLLTADFIFTGDGNLLNRKEYIEDRTAPSEWQITHVKYFNLNLQFFNDIALLSYRNEVTNKDSLTGAIEIEFISWSDVYKKENGKWKIGAAHVIDFRMEKK